MFEKSTSDAHPYSDTHRCLAGARCRTPEIVDGVRQGCLTEKAGVLCPECMTYVGSCVRQLPRDWVQLWMALGERAGSTGEVVRSSPSPAIPISATRDRLMAEILELADHAGALVADELHADQPTGRRQVPEMIVDGRRKKPEEGSAADVSSQIAEPAEGRRLTAAIAMVEPRIGLLISAPPAATQVWCRPKRCDPHTETIEAAEAALAAELRMPSGDNGPKQIRAFLRQWFRANTQRKHLGMKPKELSEKQRDAMDAMRRAFAAAAACDTCNGWHPHLGQAREYVEVSGIEVAMAMVDVHNRVRAELGKTRLRHRYAMPCPRCGGRVGRDDGVAIVNCDSCGGAWTERDYKFLAGLIVDEGKEVDILKYLLAEGYSRLDDITALLAKIRDDERINVPGSAVAFLIAELDKIIADHVPAAEREVAGDKKATAERQADEDNWTWKNAEKYQRPRPKKRAASKFTGPRIATSSLVLVNEDPNIDIDAVRMGERKCPDCNCVHAGECA